MVSCRGELGFANGNRTQFHWYVIQFTVRFCSKTLPQTLTIFLRALLILFTISIYYNNQENIAGNINGFNQRKVNRNKSIYGRVILFWPVSGGGGGGYPIPRNIINTRHSVKLYHQSKFLCIQYIRGYGIYSFILIFYIYRFGGAKKLVL